MDGESNRFIVSSGEAWSVNQPEGDDNEALCFAALERLAVNNNATNKKNELEAKKEGWQLSKVSFMTNGKIGAMILDTGASVTAVSDSFLTGTGVSVRPLPAGQKARKIRVPTGEVKEAVGVCDLPVKVQLMLRLENGQHVHWDRSFVLKEVWVLPFGEHSPRDLYVSWPDWKFNPNGSTPSSPLGSMVHLVATGAELVDTPRAPPPGTTPSKITVARLESDWGDVPVPFATVTADGDTSGPVTSENIEARLYSKIPTKFRHSKEAKILVGSLTSRLKAFGPLNPDDCTEVVDFELIGEPEQVSFRVPVNRKATGQAAVAGLEEWLAQGICERVAWSEPSYGFVFVVPKPNGKFRVTINPSGVNPATKRVNPEGGYMPDNMVNEAMKAGHCKIAAKMDLTSAFLTMKLGNTAQRLSTFTTQIGKMRWKHGYFGWHSFPAMFQRIIMEKVVLPTLDLLPSAVILAWIDDIIVAAGDFWVFQAALIDVIDRIVAIGGRLSLDKCEFLVEQFDWCGIEVDLTTAQWRISRKRVESLTKTPVPKDRETLRHVIGIIRYYYFGVSDHKKQREHLAKLDELDVQGIVLKKVWTEKHTQAMQAALSNIENGDWLLVYDPRQHVHVTCDASGNHGYCVTAHQYDKTSGKMRPIAFYSSGWKGPQLEWIPQVKECYAQRTAVTKIMPANFPFAQVILLGDNRNLSSEAKSADGRVTRWQQEIKDSGCVQRYWLPGEWNTIADYGSRAVVADPVAKLSEEEDFERYIYSLNIDPAPEGETAQFAAAGPTVTPTDETVVPGHLPMAAWVAKIATAQADAPVAERFGWKVKYGRFYKKVELKGRTLHMKNSRLLIPADANELKQGLLRMGHDDNAHYVGGERTVENLLLAKVWWEGLEQDAQAYVDSCFRCKVAKPPSHKPAEAGSLNPTISPHVHHTWYADFKGPLPHDTGYILLVVESLTRMVKLRYVPKATAKELIEEMHEVIDSFNTQPVLLRTDGGQPFDSDEFKGWCDTQGIAYKKGAPYHSQGQGMAETRFRGLAGALMATLGGKAPREWWKGPLLGRLERIINSTYVDSIGGSPYWAMYGREPRTPLAAAVDWTHDEFGERIFGIKGITPNDFNEILAAHHDVINKVQERVSIATSVAQALTKNTWDAKHGPVDFKVGQWVIVHRTAPNRLTPHFIGPYKVTSVTGDGNFVKGRHFLSGGDDTAEGPFHVSRLLDFTAPMARAKPVEIAQWQLEAGSAIVDEVIEHRILQDGSYEFHIRWLGVKLTSWVHSSNVKQVIKVIKYCEKQGLHAPGKEPKVKPAKPAAANGRKKRQ